MKIGTRVQIGDSTTIETGTIIGDVDNNPNCYRIKIDSTGEIIEAQGNLLHIIA